MGERRRRVLRARLAGLARAVLRGGVLGLVLGAAYGVGLGAVVMTAGLVLDEGLGGLADVPVWFTLVFFASAYALLIGGFVGGITGATLAAVLWTAVPRVSRLLGRSRAARHVRPEPLAAGLLAGVFGLVVMPMRIVSNTTLLFDGAADGTLQVVVGKLLPAVLMAVVAARRWTDFAPTAAPRAEGGAETAPGPAR